MDRILIYPIYLLARFILNKWDKGKEVKK